MPFFTPKLVETRVSMEGRSPKWIPHTYLWFDLQKAYTNIYSIQIENEKQNNNSNTKRTNNNTHHQSTHHRNHTDDRTDLQ